MMLIEILKPSFLLHHAVYGSVVVGFVCPLVGVYFLLRRLVFWGVALPQVSAAGIAFAFMLQGFGLNFLAGGESEEKHLAIIGSILFTLLAILIMTSLEKYRKGVAEGRIGVIYALAGACSILFVAWNASGETEMLGLLKGEIVSISESDFHSMLLILMSVSVCMFLFQREFTLVSFDRELMMSLGRNADAWDMFLYLIVGVTVSLGVMTVGPLVIFGYLVIPPMAALPWASSMLSFSLIASLLGGISAFAGFYVSYVYDLPLGPVNIGTACLILVISSVARYGGRAAIKRFSPRSA